MAKLHFKYASMNSGKSIDLMRTVYNYEENGFKVLVIKPSKDTKGGLNIESRVGLSREVDIVLKHDDEVFEALKGKLDDVESIFIDEAQFLSTKQVDDLFILTKAIDIPIICYGLRNNFKMEAFEGSARLLVVADVLEELQTICNCGKIARFVGRKFNGAFEDDGSEIIIDGTKGYEYEPLCGECYLQKVKKLNLNTYKKNLR